MSTASMFADQANARRVLIRLGEEIPESLSTQSIATRFMVGASFPSANTVRFADGSVAKHNERTGEWSKT